MSASEAQRGRSTTMAFKRMSRLYRLAIGAVILGAFTCSARPGNALQPLEAFLALAAETNPDVRVAQATQAQREAEVDRATGALLPAIQAQGTYTRNQYEVAFPATLIGGTGTLTIVPLNQLDASLTVSIPIVDIGAWRRRSAAQSTRDSTAADHVSVRLNVARGVARAYFQVVANEAVLFSAHRNVEVSQQNATTTVAKRDGGTASELDVQRARGDVARAQQDLATAVLQVTTARRSLESLSGLTPEPTTAFPTDDLRQEPPLEAWLASSDRIPSVQSALAARRSAERSANAARAAWFPTLTASAQERFTNAPSLSLHDEYYLLQATAVWKIDATIPAAARAQEAAARAAIARGDKARRDAEDAIFDDWHQVRAATDRVRAARTQVEAATLAAGLARDRYLGGIATQLDVLQAQQDLFRADVARIQAEADLAYARASLRLDSAHTTGDPRP